MYMSSIIPALGFSTHEFVWAIPYRIGAGRKPNILYEKFAIDTPCGLISGSRDYIICTVNIGSKKAPKNRIIHIKIEIYI
jgi:hypothetical protein